MQDEYQKVPEFTGKTSKIIYSSYWQKFLALNILDLVFGILFAIQDLIFEN